MLCLAVWREGRRMYLSSKASLLIDNEKRKQRR